MVIAIDGPAGVGKSTVARKVAELGGLSFLNSGNFYRAITWKAISEGVPLDDPGAIVGIAQAIDLRMEGDRLLVDGVERDAELHTDAVDRWVARHSALVPLRREVNRRLREVAKNRDVVMEGRDIATVVFPDAEVKVYLDATVEARALRRYRQGTSDLSLGEIAETIRQRDEIDRNKEEGSLRIAEGALHLDTSDLTIEEVCAKVLQIIPPPRMKNTSRSQVNTMVENEQKSTEHPSAPLQEELQEQYLKNLDDLVEGQLVDGTIVQVGPENVYLDVGYKSEGKIPLSEFQTVPKTGDVVQVVLMKKENRAGEVIVSKQKADEKLFWKRLRTAFQEHLPIEGKVAKTIKGGFEIALGFGITGFNPISKMDLQRVEDPEKYVGLESKFLVERIYNENRVNIILSRRNWLEEEVTGSGTSSSGPSRSGTRWTGW